LYFEFPQVTNTIVLHTTILGKSFPCFVKFPVLGLYFIIFADFEKRKARSFGEQATAVKSSVVNTKL
jgi:hypothetical protein